MFFTFFGPELALLKESFDVSEQQRKARLALLTQQYFYKSMLKDLLIILKPIIEKDKSFVVLLFKYVSIAQSDSTIHDYIDCILQDQSILNDFEH